MIYNFTINIADRRSQPIRKQFYLTAESDSAFYRRCLEQYRAQRDSIEILERISDDSVEINSPKAYKPPKVGIEPTIPEVSDEQLNVINEMIAKVRGYGEKDIDAKKAEGWLVVETETPENDLKVAFGLYKKVKLYYKRTGAKKNKLYIILCKDKKKEQSGKRSSSKSSKSSKAGNKKKVK